MPVTFASVDASVANSSFGTFVTFLEMFLHFTRDCASRHLQMPGNGMEAVVVTQAVFYFRTVCQREMGHVFSPMLGVDCGLLLQN